MKLALPLQIITFKIVTFKILLFLWVLLSPMTGFAACIDCHSDQLNKQTHKKTACTSCHKGQDKKTKEAAHKGLIKQPGTIQNFGKSCSEAGCHRGQVYQVQHSLMTQMTGLIQVTKRAFGEQGPTPKLADLKDTGAEGYLRKKCISCHLGQDLKNESDPIKKRGGGCLACHKGDKPQGSHVTIDKKITSQRCFGCHARSGRISLTYAGIMELSPEQETPKSQHLTDGRHTARGVMGDGGKAKAKSEQMEIQCSNCHGQAQTEPFRGKYGSFLKNIKTRGDQRRLKLKLAKSELKIATVAAGHGGKDHQRLTCDACHSTWAPQCYGCHVEYKKEGKQYDSLTHKPTLGRWEETAWAFEAKLPALGLYKNRVMPFVPGMNWSLKQPNQKIKHQSFFSPLSPHSIGKARSCASCHNSDRVFGKNLGLAKFGEFASEKSWSGDTLRKDSRAFTNVEIQKIKEVGRCLQCHPERDKLYQNFEEKSSYKHKK